MGVTHDDRSTFPRLADELGFIRPQDVTAVAEAVVTTQRDFGDRVSRRHARLKYTIERIGLGAFIAQVEGRSGVQFERPREVHFTGQGDRYGWVENADGSWCLTLYIENGRIEDRDDQPLMAGLREIAGLHRGDFRITPNQNLVVAGVSAEHKAAIEDIARRHGLLADGRSATRLASIACVALPTCPQAMAEAERYFPDLLARIESLAARYGIDGRGVVIRMTGCPNGCARPYVAEIGLVGKGPGRYNLLLGGDGIGRRLARLYRTNLNETDLLAVLEGLLAQYADDAQTGERLGDFVVRSGWVRPVVNPAEDFHDSA